MLADAVRATRSFRIEGFVRAVVPDRNIVVLQDASASVLLELPPMNRAIRVGDRLAVAGDRCPLIQTRYGIQVGTAPVVDNDGIHSAMEKSGDVFLASGMNPIRLMWFNAAGRMGLNLEYEGPGVSKQEVTSSILWHDAGESSAQKDLKPGLQYLAYEGNGWGSVPDFFALKPVAKGVATNFNLAYRTRDENSGLLFQGFIQIDREGIYTFHLNSDDGSRLYVGKPSVSCETIASPDYPMPASENLAQTLADRSRDHWIELEGEVVFSSRNGRSLEMEMLVDGNRVPVTVVEGVGLFSANLLHQWIQVDGICKFSRDSEDKKLAGVFVPGAEQVKILNSAKNAREYSTNDVLTTAAEVRRLKPEEAGRHIPSKIRGVVIYSTSTAMVLQDSTGGIFIGSDTNQWSNQPGVGELWEIEGATDPGLFSPVIVATTTKFLGAASLPEPIHPTRDQLMNGNLDAEYVELHGVLTAVSNTELTLLTPDGNVTVIGSSDRPLPQLPAPAQGTRSLVGSVVRIRGCFATLVDLKTRQVIPGKIYLYPGLLEVEDPTALNPFLLPARKASDLMWFDSRASALQRTKLAGQIIYALPGEYFVLDNGSGFRVLADHSPPLQPGDLIEAVGFPKLGGPSPVLQQAQIRKTGHANLPDPAPVSSEKLLDRNRDSTLVQVEAMLISDTIHQDERVLELQSGPRHFMARLKSGSQPAALMPAGCRLQLTGVYASADDEQQPAGANLSPFELLLNNSASIVVLKQPSWLTVRRAIVVMLALSGVLGLTFIWVALLRRKIEERTAQLKKEIEERQLVEQHHAVELERTRVAQDLHDELGSGLTEVGILGSLANTPAVPPETRARYLNQITQTARSLVTSLDEIVWAVNPDYDSAESLAGYFSLFAESLLGLAGIACRLRVVGDIPEYPLDSRMRHGVFCAYKEALNNVIRHSGATEVQLIFEATGGELVISVIDNGRGFEFVGGPPGKDGLAGLAQRMQQLGGNCQITSQPGQGTKVEIRLPLNGVQHGQSRNR